MLGLYKTLKFHRQMWRWVFMLNTTRKKDWPGWRDPPKGLEQEFQEAYDESYCFFCSYATNRTKDTDAYSCINCPGLWPGGGYCDGHFGLWTQWTWARNNAKRDLAFKIYMIPLKPYPTRSLATHNRR